MRVEGGGLRVDQAVLLEAGRAEPFVQLLGSLSGGAGVSGAPHLTHLHPFSLSLSERILGCGVRGLGFGVWGLWVCGFGFGGLGL